MEILSEKLRKPIFQAIDLMMTLIEKPKRPIFQAIGMKIGDTILTLMKPLYPFLKMPFLVTQ